MKYRIVWLGSTDFSKGPLLQVIGDGHEVVAVCSALPDSPTVRVAKERGIPWHVVRDISDPGFALNLMGYRADLFVVCAFPILPEEIISIPRLGCIGIHPSRLPEFRGAAPIEAFLQSGNDSTGVTTFLISKGVDNGDVLQQETWRFDKISDMFPVVQDVLESGARELIADTLRDFEIIMPIPQSDFGYTPGKAPKITKESRRVRFIAQDSSDVIGKMRAFSGNGGIWTTLMGTSTEVIIHEGYFDFIDTQRLCGCYVGQLYYDNVKRDFFIPLGRDESIVLVPRKIQTAGRKVMSVKDWRNGIKMNEVRFD